jgi:hypothetical protein
MNKALYFPLFVNDYEEVQLTTLKRKFGIKGYGIYTFLRTKLQDVDNYEYPIRMIGDLSYMAGIPETEMTDIINNSGLFVIGNDFFSCPLLDEALNRHNGIKAKKSEQGKKGGQVRMSTLTPEERKELSQKGVDARKNKQPAQPAFEKNMANLQPAKNDNAGCVGSSQPSNAGSKPDNEIDIESEMEIDMETDTDKDKEKDNKREIDSEREKNSPISGIDLSKEIKKYLESPSKFLYGHNQNLCSSVYESYRVLLSDPKIKSIGMFEKVLYYHLLKVTNSNNVHELNEEISKGSLSLTLEDICNTVQLVSRKKVVNDDYKKEVYAIIGTPNLSQENK